MNNKRNGFFISFEGIDGSGKTSQKEKLVKYLEDNNCSVVKTREPGGTPLAEKIRTILLSTDNNVLVDPLTEAYLFAAARSNHVEKLIIPALEEGKIVITDRFIDSSLSYQGVMRNLGIDIVYDLNKYALRNTLPDLTLFIDLSEEEYLARLNQKWNERDRIEEDLSSLDNFYKIKNSLTKIIEMFPERIVLIDGDKSKEEVFSAIKEVADERLKAHGYVLK